MNSMMTLWIRFFSVISIVTISIIVPGRAIASEYTAGPYVRYEAVGSSSIVNAEPTPTRENSEKQRYRTFSTYLAAPIEYGPWQGGLQFHLVDQKRTQTHSTPMPQVNLPKQFNTADLGFGAVRGPNPSELRPFIAYAVYFNPGRFDARPMHEYYLGGLFEPKWQNGVRAQTTVALRVRYFPFGFEYLPIIGHEFPFSQNLTLEVVIPSNITLHWYGENWQANAGVALEGRQAPARIDGMAVWITGYEARSTIALLYRLTGPIFVTLSGGSAREHLTVVDENDRHRNTSYDKSPAPYGMLALETYIRSNE